MPSAWQTRRLISECTVLFPNITARQRKQTAGARKTGPHRTAVGSSTRRGVGFLPDPLRATWGSNRPTRRPPFFTAAPARRVKAQVCVLIAQDRAARGAVQDGPRVGDNSAGVVLRASGTPS